MIFGRAPVWMASAPGRVNLIGEHTDYNLLPVLPMTLDRKIRVLVAPRSDQKVRIYNTDAEFPAGELDLSQPLEKVPGEWINYIRAGVRAGMISLETAPAGMDLLVDSDLPAAAGLSSSSALVIASALAFLQANGLHWTPEELAMRTTQGERFVGTAGGGMDQAVISMAHADSALLVEFDPVRTEPILIPQDLAIWILNSGQRAEKSGAARYSYNLRSLECGLAVELLWKSCKAVGEPGLGGEAWKTLRDVYDYCHAHSLSWSELLLRHLPAAPVAYESLMERMNAEDFQALADSRLLAVDEMGEWLPAGYFQVYARAAHVMSEADRVYAFRNALRSGQLESAALLAQQSHASCRDLYQISTVGIEHLASRARASGASSARITGAGFGGCLVAMTAAAHSETFRQEMLRSRFNAADIIEAIPGGAASCTRVGQ